MKARVIDLDDALAGRFNRTANDTESAWHDPDMSLLGTGRRPAPAFPLELLGPFWSAWAARRAQEASAPVDYVALSLLACAAASLANVRWPVAGAGWAEPPVLWAGLVGSPSSGKSPSMDAAFDLVRHAEDLMSSGFDHTRRDYETKRQPRNGAIFGKRKSKRR